MPFLKDYQEHIEDQENTIIWSWTPNHIGIHENEAGEKAAKQAYHKKWYSLWGLQVSYRELYR